MPGWAVGKGCPLRISPRARPTPSAAPTCRGQHSKPAGPATKAAGGQDSAATSQDWLQCRCQADPRMVPACLTGESRRQASCPAARPHARGPGCC
jgi:hypothetical protein